MIRNRLRTTAAKVRAGYRRTWFGAHVHLTRGLLLAQTGAIIGLLIAVPYLTSVNADAARQRDCVRRAESAAELDATALAGVEHAEQTVVIMQKLAERLNRSAAELERVGSGTPEAAAIVAEFREFGVDDVPHYADGVADFRQVAEAYTPTTYRDCGVDRPGPGTP